MNLYPKSLPETSVTVITAAAGDWVDGRRVENAEEDGDSFDAVVIPFPEKRLKQFPEGEQAFGAKLVITRKARVLQTSDEETETAADFLRIPSSGGRRFKIFDDGDWTRYGFNRYIATLAGPV